MSEVRRCEYCDRETTNEREWIDNRNYYVCDRVKCQQELWKERNEIKRAAKNYDDWVTRSE